MATGARTTIESRLGAKAEALLGFKSPKIAKERLHLPGPDFVDRVLAAIRSEYPGAGESAADLRSRPAGRHRLSFHPAGGPGHRALGGRQLREESRLLRSARTS